MSWVSKAWNAIVSRIPWNVSHMSRPGNRWILGYQNGIPGSCRSWPFDFCEEKHNMVIKINCQENWSTKTGDLSVYTGLYPTDFHGRSMNWWCTKPDDVHWFPRKWPKNGHQKRPPFFHPAEKNNHLLAPGISPPPGSWFGGNAPRMHRPPSRKHGKMIWRLCWQKYIYYTENYVAWSLSNLKLGWFGETI